MGVVGLSAPGVRAGGDRQQQRGHVDARAHLGSHHPGRARDRCSRILHQQRHADGLLVGAGPLAAQPVGRPVLPVVGGEEDHRVGRHLRAAFQRPQHAADVTVHLALELRVEIEELQPQLPSTRSAERHGAEGRRRGLLEGALQPGLVALEHQFRGLEVRGQAMDGARGGGLRRHPIAPDVPPGDVVGIHEGDGRAPRLGTSLVGEPAGELGGDAGVDRPALPRCAVRGRVDPPGEPVVLQRRFAHRLGPVVVVGGSGATCRTSGCGSRARAACSPRSGSRGRGCSRR